LKWKAKNIEAQCASERTLIQANQETGTQKVKACTALRDDQVKANLEEEKKLQRAQLDAKARMHEIDQWAAEQLMKSEMELQHAKNDARIDKFWK
jgi:hypothetical protein